MDFKISDLNEFARKMQIQKYYFFCEMQKNLCFLIGIIHTITKEHIKEVRYFIKKKNNSINLEVLYKQEFC